MSDDILVQYKYIRCMMMTYDMYCTYIHDIRVPYNVYMYIVMPILCLYVHVQIEWSAVCTVHVHAPRVLHGGGGGGGGGINTGQQRTTDIQQGKNGD